MIGKVKPSDIPKYTAGSAFGIEYFNAVNGFRPFLGAGIGQADIQNAKDKELAMSLYAGGRYSINENTYVGVKGTYMRVDGPEDKLGIKFDDITMYGITLSVGYQF